MGSRLAKKTLGGSCEWLRVRLRRVVVEALAGWRPGLQRLRPPGRHRVGVWGSGGSRRRLPRERSSIGWCRVDTKGRGCRRVVRSRLPEWFAVRDSAGSAYTTGRWL